MDTLQADAQELANAVVLVHETLMPVSVPHEDRLKIAWEIVKCAFHSRPLPASEIEEVKALSKSKKAAKGKE